MTDQEEDLLEEIEVIEEENEVALEENEEDSLIGTNLELASTVVKKDT